MNGTGNVKCPFILDYGAYHSFQILLKKTSQKAYIYVRIFSFESGSDVNDYIHLMDSNHDEQQLIKVQMMIRYMEIMFFRINFVLVFDGVID